MTKFVWNKTNALQRYRAAVQNIEAANYLDIDTADIDYDISARGTVALCLADYTAAERGEIAALDERFLTSLPRALRRSHHETWYREAGKRRDAKQWWWHIKD